MSADSPSSSSLDNRELKSGTSRPPPLSKEERIEIVRKHFVRKGYRVHSGLQFGCEIVLYSDSPERVHSDFCIKLAECNQDDYEEGYVDWRCLQTLARSMADLHKTLIVCHVRQIPDKQHQWTHVVEEIAVASEYAPFRYKVKKDVGEQRKRQKRPDD